MRCPRPGSIVRGELYSGGKGVNFLKNALIELWSPIPILIFSTRAKWSIFSKVPFFGSITRTPVLHICGGLTSGTQDNCGKVNNSSIGFVTKMSVSK